MIDKIETELSWSCVEQENPNVTRFDKNNYSIWVYHNQEGEIVDIEGTLPRYYRNAMLKIVGPDFANLIKEL